MHPFWVVRRMTQNNSATEAIACKEDKPPRLHPRFNCTLQKQVMNVVRCGVVIGTSLNTTMICEAPLLTNINALVEGEELILEIAELTPKADTRKRTWRTVFEEAEQQKGNESKNNKNA